MFFCNYSEYAASCIYSLFPGVQSWISDSIGSRPCLIAVATKVEINFRFDGNDKIIILDFPTPLNAIRQHLELEPQFVQSLGNDGKLKKLNIIESEEWKKAEKEELENFKATIYDLMTKGRTGEDHSIVEFVNIDYVPLENKGN